MQMRSLSLASLMLAASVLLATAEDKPTDATASTAPAAPTASQWSEFKSDKQGFAVSFPGAPKVTTAPVEGQNPLLQHDFQVSVGEDTVYTVVVFEYPQGKAPKADTDYYVKLMNAYAKGSETRLRRRGPATVDGHAGFEGIADDGKNKLTHLVTVVPQGNRIYMLASALPRAKGIPEDAERFRDSFRLLGGEADPAEEAAASASGR
jgi:hypothetical protein